MCLIIHNIVYLIYKMYSIIPCVYLFIYDYIFNFLITFGDGGPFVMVSAPAPPKRLCTYLVGKHSHFILSVS